MEGQSEDKWTRNDVSKKVMSQYFEGSIEVCWVHNESNSDSLSKLVLCC